MTEKIEIEIKNQLIDLTNDFCKKYVNEEYADLSRKLINKMARKRSVPFLAGRLEIWAAAVIHSLGTINFLYDRKTSPYASYDTVIEHFSVSKSTVGQKSKLIRDMFSLQHFDAEFSTKANLKDNPFNRLAMVNGFLVMLDR